ncbi:MAG: hypothetical protein V4819_22725 [Verrucomicrobiota bacterium]
MSTKKAQRISTTSRCDEVIPAPVADGDVGEFADRDGFVHHEGAVDFREGMPAIRAFIPT